MTITSWRISKARFADSLFSGKGAEAVGGRFNSPGRRVIYAAGSLSLGILEILVQANTRQRLEGLVYASVSFHSTCVACLDAMDLPPGWDARPVSSISQRIGDAWVKRQDSLVLRVPSVVVPGECNFVINPDHPDATRLTFGEVKPLHVDGRLTH